jgi:hypothetical protein
MFVLNCIILSVWTDDCAAVAVVVVVAVAALEDDEEEDECVFLATRPGGKLDTGRANRTNRRERGCVERRDTSGESEVERAGSGAVDGATTRRAWLFECEDTWSLVDKGSSNTRRVKRVDFKRNGNKMFGMESVSPK